MSEKKRSSWRKQRDFVCPYCEKDFLKDRQLKQHIRDAHKDKVSNGTAPESKEEIHFVG